MWYRFKVTSFILILGTTHGAFRSRRSVNPEANMNISQIISYWGYPGEVHDVVTDDGYILGLYRIPYGKANNDNSAFITFSTIPKIAEKVKVFFALAPVFSIKYSNSPLIKMAYKWKSVIKAFVGNKAFLPNTSFKRFVGAKLCPLKIFGKICREVLFLMYGCDLENLNMSRVDVYMSHNPAGTSVQNMLHWSQLFNSSRLRAFDWGSPVLNWMHFNQTTSPFYNVTCMNVSTSTWNGARDVLADPQDINNLLSEITNHIYHKTISSYNHIDFLFGLDVYHQVYREIIDIIQGTL
ncbi:lipase member J-like [Puma concolor]|uniref:Lipase member J-like n=1 Tax=Puma concolor TaxID=9696 RepID=A0A6P6H5W6_PUMCO|nr:lipase member J-like [Puma concolor]